MKWLAANAGSAARPRRPRSLSVQMPEPKSSAGVARSVPSWTTRSAPDWLVTSRRPSGANANAVGADTDATRESVKPAGTAAVAADGTPRAATATTTASVLIEKMRPSIVNDTRPPSAESPPRLVSKSTHSETPAIVRLIGQECRARPVRPSFLSRVVIELRFSILRRPGHLVQGASVDVESHLLVGARPARLADGSSPPRRRVRGRLNRAGGPGRGAYGHAAIPTPPSGRRGRADQTLGLCIVPRDAAESYDQFGSFGLFESELGSRRNDKRWSAYLDTDSQRGADGVRRSIRDWGCIACQTVR